MEKHKASNTIESAIRPTHQKLSWRESSVNVKQPPFDVNTNPRPERSLRSSLPLTDKTKCVICQGEKRSKKTPTYEKLRLCSTFVASVKLTEAAKLWQDERVMLALCGCEADAIAAAIMYHPSCYSEFTQSDNLEKLRDTPAESSDGYCDAFLELSEEIQRKVIIGGEVIGMKKLLQTFFVNFEIKGSGFEAVPCGEAETKA